MSLPIDPSTITRADIGERIVSLEMNHLAAVEFVREICLEEGFGIAVEFSMSDLLDEKIGVERDPIYVLGACNPHMANRALDESLDIAGIAPCNVVVREVDPGVQEVHHVSIMRIARLLGMAPDNEEWAAIVADTGALVDAAFSRLEADPNASGPS